MTMGCMYIEIWEKTTLSEFQGNLIGLLYYPPKIRQVQNFTVNLLQATLSEDSKFIF